VHDDGAGGEVAQSALGLVQEHHEDADRVVDGQRVQYPHEVASRCLPEADRATIDANDANADDALSRRLAVPDRFEEDVVAEKSKLGALTNTPRTKRRLDSASSGCG